MAPYGRRWWRAAARRGESLNSGPCLKCTTGTDSERKVEEKVDNSGVEEEEDVEEATGSAEPADELRSGVELRPVHLTEL